jgi:octaprenyl-diphosphate synthase
MAASLNPILLPVRDELSEFATRLKKSRISDVPLVNLIAKYLVRTKGKQVRPMLVLLAAKACGEVNDTTYRAALLVELLHTATLVHDDVIDEANERRGFASIRALWHNKVGVLMGDYLLAKGLLLTIDSKQFHLLEITSTAVRRMSEGELYQLQKSRQMNTDEAAYFRIIADKTASLIATCTEMGAASVTDGGGNTEQRRMLREYGEFVGIAFQIRDDLFDFEPNSALIGKPVGNDLENRKLTLPILHTLSKIDPKEARRIRLLIKSKKVTKSERDLIINLVSATGGIAYARTVAEGYAAKARAAIAPLPDTAAKQALEEFSRFVVDRVK